MNIAQLFFEAARKYPTHTALIEGTRQVTYATLEKEVQQTADYFRSKGLQPGDRVLVFIPMGIDLYRTVLAIFHAGLVAVFVDQWVNLSRLKVCCKLADCQGFVGSNKARWLKALIPALRKIPISLRTKVNAARDQNLPAASASAPIRPYNVKPDNTALITFTTGSTGTPKAADRTHAFLHEQFKSLIRVINPKPTDVDYTNLPILPLLNLATGGATVLENPKGSEDRLRKKLHRILKAHPLTRITASPALLLLIAQQVLQQQTPTDALTKLFTGGAPVYPADAQRIQQAFPQASFKAVYGSTEVEPISTLAMQDLLNTNVWAEQGLLVGVLAAQTDIHIMDLNASLPHETSEQEIDRWSLEEGQIGEIMVAGPHVLKRYFKNREAFRANKLVTATETWHRTGDSGFLKEGQLYLTGRCKDLIRKGDAWISPFVVESLLKELENVTAGTIMQQGEELVLVIEGKASEEDLTWLRKSIQYDRVVRMKQIPRDPRHRSKIDYEGLEKKL